MRMSRRLLHIKQWARSMGVATMAKKKKIHDACRPCYSIPSIVGPVFRHIRQIFRAYKCLDVEIWRYFFVDNDYFIPLRMRAG